MKGPGIRFQDLGGDRDILWASVWSLLAAFPTSTFGDVFWQAPGTGILWKWVFAGIGVGGTVGGVRGGSLII